MGVGILRRYYPYRTTRKVVEEVKSEVSQIEEKVEAVVAKVETETKPLTEKAKTEVNKIVAEVKKPAETKATRHNA